MSIERTWDTRRYQPGDEHDLLALFNRVFGKSRSLEHWRWQFAENPYAPPTIVVARRRTDELLAGSHVIMPIALDVSGERVLAGHTLDLVVHEDFRRQRLFEITARECFAWCLERGLRAVIAYPNAQSYPGFVRSLGWSRILDPQRWDLRTGWSRALGTSMPARLAASLPDAVWRAWTGLRWKSDARFRSEWTREVPADQDMLWQECAPAFRLSLWKDREYLAWRYDRNPDHRFEYIALREGDRLRALGVTLTEQGRRQICEWICLPSDRDAGRALVHAIGREAIARGDDRISFLGHDAGAMGDAFAGFQVRSAPENTLTGRGLEEGPLDQRVRDGRNWTMAYGDADYV